ncbi:unnamed protein product [Hymenolepis diminuta]|uniref:Uncharacterized protein n=1 Tax=Hymenolepis diminuta TaxID=6216 RepID=A0A564Y5Q3_HYMDI|nr:unnamed protein product [Hymenolepis diminuta]
MTHKPYLPCLDAPIDFPSFLITASFHIKSTSALMLSRGLTQVTHIKLSLFSTQEQNTLVTYGLLCFLLISYLLQHAPLSTSLSVTRINIRCGSLEYIFGLINSCCSASQLLLAILRQLRIGDRYYFRYLLASNR